MSHNENDVTMTIAGLWRYGDRRHVATGCTVLVIIIIPVPVFMVMSLCQGHCYILPRLCNKCSLGARRPPTLKPCHYHPHPPSPFLLLYYSAQKLIFVLPSYSKIRCVGYGKSCITPCRLPNIMTLKTK